MVRFIAVPASGGRVIGGFDDPEPTHGSYPSLPSATHRTVGVIDTGVVLDQEGRPHPWFGRDHLSYCAADDEDVLALNGKARESSDGHGTFVAGLILREAPTVRVRAWGVLDKDRIPSRFDGPNADDDVAVAAAIRALAINRNVHVINMSFDGGTWGESRRPKLIEDALRDLHKQRSDIAVVASAGNESLSSEVWPAAFDHVIAVGAVDEGAPVARDATPPVAPFSNTGDWVDAFASGCRVLGPFSQADGRHGWARWSGTSFAAAIVSGRIAQVALELGITGAQAWEVIRLQGRSVDGCRGVWVRSVDSPPFSSGG